MKIDKLYTLSQFVDNEEYNTYDTMQDSYKRIVKYNEFLKQPITKEMFVNEINFPNEDDYQGIIPMTSKEDYHVELKRWQEAEKKVIFKDWEEIEVVKGVKALLHDKYTLMIIPDKISLTIESNPSRVYWLKTYNDLAESTKGELELKNVEL